MKSYFFEAGFSITSSTQRYFLRVAISSEPLLFWNSFFFRSSTSSEKLFFWEELQQSWFSKEVPFKNRVFFQKSCILETAYFLKKQYAVTYFFRRGFFTQLYFLSTFVLLIYKLIHITLVSDVCVCLSSFTGKASSLCNDAWVYR